MGPVPPWVRDEEDKVLATYLRRRWRELHRDHPWCEQQDRTAAENYLMAVREYRVAAKAGDRPTSGLLAQLRLNLRAFMDRQLTRRTPGERRHREGSRVIPAEDRFGTA